MIEANDAIRVGLLGYGYSGKTFHAPLIKAVPGIELSAVSSSDASKVHADHPAMRVYTDPLALVSATNIDLVVVATPNDTHAPLARAAIEAGKHVIIDKPFTLDLTQARELVTLAQQRGVLLSVFHNRRWDSDYLAIAKAIRDGLVGNVSHFESHLDRFRPVVRDRWRERAGAGSGLWFDLGPHLVDQAVQLFGLPDGVQASLAIQRDGAVTDDWAHVILFYRRLRIVLHAGMLVAGGTTRFVVHGDMGSVVKQAADRQEKQLLEGMSPGEPGWGEDPDSLVFFDEAGHEHRIAPLSGDQRCYYAGIVEALRGKEPNPVSSDEALAVMAIVEAATRSAQSGKAIIFDWPKFVDVSAS